MRSRLRRGGRDPQSILFGVIAALPIVLAVTLGACNNNTDNTADTVATAQADCLPDLKLVDQSGQPFSPASLKGKPVLVDFFYTTCPGPCLVLTARMRSIAERLGNDLGSRASFVSVTVDPEHDTPARLLAYVKEQRADRAGWIFLTGAPTQIDALMSRFKLVRQHEADGSVDHVLEFFLVGPDGRLRFQYLASEVRSERIAGDLERAAGQRTAEASN
ncbi:MAG: SCO family protein [Deltaproteobacteria bacterium]|nr:SCO family protein [Deltaproteobacteria bacterium]